MQSQKRNDYLCTQIHKMKATDNSEKNNLHPRNLHRSRYDFELLTANCPELKNYVSINKHQIETINLPHVMNDDLSKQSDTQSTASIVSITPTMDPMGEFVNSKLSISPQGKKTTDWRDVINGTVESIEGEELSEEQFKELFREEYESPFTKFATGKLQLTKTDEKMLQHYMDESVRGESLKSMSNVRKDFYSSRKWTPMMRYSKITENIQSAFHRVFGKEHMQLFFEDLEAFLRDFVSMRKARTVIVFKDGYQRFLAHGVMRYYLLHSKSVDYNDQRLTVIQKSSRLKRLQTYAGSHPKEGEKLVLPTMSLYQYLTLLKKSSPQDVDRRVRSGESFIVQEENMASKLNISDMESGFDSTGTKRKRIKKKHLRKTTNMV